MITALPIQRAVLGGRAGVQAVLFSTEEPDPLEGIAFALRLQTHAGFGSTPLAPLGLYQDVACTVPATEDGHLVKGWKGELMGVPVTATQADDQLAPMLVFDNDIPTVLFDGVDDFLSISSYDINTSFYRVAALKVNSYAGGKGILNVGGGLAGALLLITGTGVIQFGKAGVIGFANGTTPVGTSDYATAGVAYDGTDWDIFLNGGNDGSGTSEQTFEGTAALVATYNGAALFLDGSLVALLDTEDSASQPLIDTFLTTLNP